MITETKMTKPIYLDNHATTPVDPRVVDKMLPYFGEKFGNPHSSSHYYGWEAAEAVEIAREQIAEFIGANVEEIFFTSGATEANNTAIKGVARFYKDHRKHLVTCVTEHMCVLDSAFQLEKEGFQITYLHVGADGLIDLDELKSSITNHTILVSVMAVNNEIGVIQPISEIGAICRENKVFFHTDAAQAVGKVPVNVNDMNVDLLSLTAHKVYGPMGIGALYVRKTPRVRLEPMFNGGGQESGLRSGTLSPPLCVGLGHAMQIANLEMPAEALRLIRQRDRMWKGLSGHLEGIHLNGTIKQRVPGNLSISIEGIDAASLMATLPGLALSSGSACTSESEESSHVLKAIGLSNELAEGSIRIGLGRFNTDEEVDLATDSLIDAVVTVRKERKIIAAAE